ncbi:hypothetical protein [Taibaiella koreensis]|uniref:hypothetical protein n=1 Tax=Taibaiella koreensis TaxID=1268548 RepID=UPI0013C34C1C|nr:hypothetical protein [Taibaiella koreensis]
MRNIIFSMVLLLGFSFGPASAQDIFYSREQKFTFQNSDFNVVGWSGDRLYTYRASKEGYYLDAYNDSMRLLATIALDFFPQKIYATRFYTTDDQIIVLYQAVQSSQVVQYAAKLDSRARMLQKPIALDSVKMGWLSADRQYYSSAMSGDKSKLVVFRLGKRKNGRQEFSTILLDNALNVLAKGHPFITSQDDFSLGQSLLANDGSLYLSGFNGSDERSLSGDAWLFRLAPDGAQFRDIALPLGTDYLSGLFMRADDNKDQIYIGAFFAGRKSGNLDGIVYAMFDRASDTFSVFKKIPFDDQLRNATDDRNKKKAFNDFVVRDLIVKNDGGFILVGESYYITTRTSIYGPGYGGYYSWYNNGYPTSSTREYHYGDIMVLDYDINGERKWQNFIRKEQYSQEDDGLFSSYAMLNSGASLVFLYNDFSTSKSTLNLAAVDISGSLQLKKMNPGRSAGADWLPRSGKQTDTRELLIPVLRRNSIGFARVVF